MKLFKNNGKLTNSAKSRFWFWLQHHYQHGNSVNIQCIWTHTDNDGFITGANFESDLISLLNGLGINYSVNNHEVTISKSNWINLKALFKLYMD